MYIIINLPKIHGKTYIYCVLVILASMKMRLKNKPPYADAHGGVKTKQFYADLISVCSS